MPNKLTTSDKIQIKSENLQTTLGRHYEYTVDKTKTNPEKIKLQVISVKVVDGKVQIKGKLHSGKGFYTIEDGYDFEKKAQAIKKKSLW